MTLRPKSLAFAGGYYVFPGGCVDPADRDVEPPEGAWDVPESWEAGPEFAVAAVREAFEEVGVLLCYDGAGRPLWQPEGAAEAARELAAARRRLLEGKDAFRDVLGRHGWRLAWDRLRYIGRWVTPPVHPRRYDTRFFLADVSGCIEPVPHRTEVASGVWMPLDEAVAHARGEDGAVPMMSPTVGTLYSLALHPDVASASVFFARRKLPPVLVASTRKPSPLDAALESLGVVRLAIESPTLKPWSATNVYFIVNGGEALIVDAGDGGEAGAQRIRDVWVRYGRPRIVGLALTHGHTDHARGALEVSRALGGVALWAHPAEKARIEELAAPVRVERLLYGGETMRVGSLPVHVLHTPGHARGHLSFWLQPHGVILVGDVASGEGSVWVGPPDGRLQDYLATLSRLQALPLRVVGPGHGPPLGDPARQLQALIERRLERQEQIVSLLADGVTRVDDIVRALYEGRIPPEVLRVARRTVLGHLEKLVEDGRVRPPADEDGPYRLAERDG